MITVTKPIATDQTRKLTLLKVENVSGLPVPEFLDPAADEAHLSRAELSSDANKEYGRPFRLVAFRWLDADEV